MGAVCVAAKGTRSLVFMMRALKDVAEGNSKVYRANTFCLDLVEYCKTDGFTMQINHHQKLRLKES